MSIRNFVYKNVILEPIQTIRFKRSNFSNRRHRSLKYKILKLFELFLAFRKVFQKFLVKKSENRRKFGFDHQW